MWCIGVALAGTVNLLEEVEPLRGLRLDTTAVTPPRRLWDGPLGEATAGIQRQSGGGAAKAWGAIHIDEPIEAVWQVLNDEARMLERLPVTTSAVLSGDLHGCSAHQK